jgi:glyceraldehyde-3-phosphate dehydrogenase/erythrose-4-phosphate dehydrogenase
MGMKKTLREVLHKHPDLFDLVIMLAEKDDVMASEEEENGVKQIIIGREGKKKKKQFVFSVNDDGYSFKAAQDKE